MALPLFSGWTISGDALPARLLASAPAPRSFALPGAEALSGFAELLGEQTAEPAADAQEAPMPGAPFALPALIPQDAPGTITLSREIDFSALSAERAWLSMDMLCGSGEVMLTGCPPRFAGPGMLQQEMPVLRADFTSGPLLMDVTQALLTRRRFRLTLRFDATRPAGVCGAILLRTAHGATLENICVSPQPVARTLELQMDATALRAGGFVLRAQLCPAAAPQTPQEAPPVHEITLRLAKGETKPVHLVMDAPIPSFLPGKAYAAPGLKLWLSTQNDAKKEALCESAALLCGLPGPAPASYLPLTAGECRQPPEELVQSLGDLHIACVSLPIAAPDMLYRLFTRAGIGALQTAATRPDARRRLSRYPCVTFEKDFSAAFPLEQEPALSAWRLCGLVTYPRAAEPGMTAADMLREAAGRALSPTAPPVQEVLAWLRAFSIRLRAEAIRQGKASGAYCAPGEWREADIAQALQAALAPLHLSALPLCGAWWTCSHFSASLHAFIPEGQFPQETPLRAEAVLEDGPGAAIARRAFPCPARGGALGLIEAALPDTPGVLELTTRLYAGEDMVEESTLPVYVGERGQLEAAF